MDKKETAAKTKPSNIGVKDFVGKLRDKVKSHYKESIAGVVGLVVLAIALTVLIYVAFAYAMQMMSIRVMMLMYGMTTTSTLLVAAAELIVVLVIAVLAYIFIYFLSTAVTYSFQDVVKNDSEQVSIKSTWAIFKRIPKNQLIRICLYQVLFIFLWQLPFKIIVALLPTSGAWKYAVIIVNILAYLVLLWKTIEYSQSLFLYRAKLQDFRAQSMRHALTASRRFMGGHKANYILVNIVAFIPAIVWTAVFGGIIYYGIYTWTVAVIYIGLVILLLGLFAYLPVSFFLAPLYFEETKPSVDVEKAFEKTFKDLKSID